MPPAGNGVVVSWDFAVSCLAAGVMVAHLMGAGGPGARCGRDGGFNGEERPWFWEITR
jgi:hypothetical protein